jgi:hypothetical protein
LKPAWQIVHKTLSRKTQDKKRTGGVAHGVGSEFKPQYCKKKKKKRKVQLILYLIFLFFFFEAGSYYADWLA